MAPATSFGVALQWVDLLVLLCILGIVGMGVLLWIPAGRALDKLAPKKEFMPRIDPAVATGASDRLRFRRPVDSDVEALISLYEEPAYLETNGWTDQTLEAAKQALRDPKKFRIVSRVTLLAVLPEGDIVGASMIAFGPVPGRKEARSVSLSLTIAERYRGQRFGLELMDAMIRVAEDFTPRPIWVGTATTNVAMQKIMERLGHAPEPKIELFSGPNGQEFDSLWYQVSSKFAGSPALFRRLYKR